MEIGFSLGSNLGDRLQHLKSARDRIAAVPSTTLLGQSPVYETEPVDVKEDYKALSFLNAALVVDSSRVVEEWLERIAIMEAELGRVRGEDRNAPRTVDVDVLYAGDACIDSGGITVPHPRWAERRFVVQPLADLRPGLVLPGAGKSVAEVLAGLEGEAVEVFARDW